MQYIIETSTNVIIIIGLSEVFMMNHIF